VCDFKIYHRDQSLGQRFQSAIERAKVLNGLRKKTRHKFHDLVEKVQQKNRADKIRQKKRMKKRKKDIKTMKQKSKIFSEIQQHMKPETKRSTSLMLAPHESGLTSSSGEETSLEQNVNTDKPSDSRGNTL